VAIDMALSTSIANLIGRLSDADFVRILATLQELGLPLSSPLLKAELCLTALRKAACHRGGAFNLVIVESIGNPAFLQREDLGDGNIAEGIEHLSRSIRKLCPNAGGDREMV
jgi:3-dehydroquinate synthetase